MARCKVVRGGWRWRRRDWSAGDVIEDVSPRQVQVWANGGYVEPLADAPRVEAAVVAPAPENMAERTDRPEPRHVGGGWYVVPGVEHKVRKSDLTDLMGEG
jgi:hypothetical protein